MFFIQILPKVLFIYLFIIKSGKIYRHFICCQCNEILFCHQLKENISLNFSYVTLLARVYMWYLWPWHHFHVLERLHSSYLCGGCLYICPIVYIPGEAGPTHIHWPWMNHRWPSVIPEVKPALDFSEVTLSAMSLLHDLRGTTYYTSNNDLVKTHVNLGKGDWSIIIVLWMIILSLL